MQQRVRAIIIESGAIALIERNRRNGRYFVCPGGRVEAGETVHQALVRGLMEETGLKINAGREVATGTFPDHV